MLNNEVNFDVRSSKFFIRYNYLLTNEVVLFYAIILTPCIHNINNLPAICCFH
jgi:hypothetical protein